MSKKELEKRKWDIKKIEAKVKLESTKNIRWIIIGIIILGVLITLTRFR